MLQSSCGNIRIAFADLGEENPSQIETWLKDMNDLLIQCKAPTVMKRKDANVRDWLSDQDISAIMEYIYEKAGVSTTTKPAWLKWKMPSNLAMGESESIDDLTTSDDEETEGSSKSLMHYVPHSFSGLKPVEVLTLAKEVDEMTFYCSFERRLLSICVPHGPSLLPTACQRSGFLVSNTKPLASHT